MESQPPEAQVLSFRHLLTEAIENFLVQQELAATYSAKVIGELIATLSRYHEEGAPLSPQVFLTALREPMLKALGGHDAIRIGGGPRTIDTMRRALKQCAPLSVGGWCLYFAESSDGWEYGVFRSEATPLTASPFDRLRTLRHAVPRIIGVQQLAESVLELRSSDGGCKYIYLSSARTDAPLPTLVVETLVSAVTADVEPGLREPSQAFFRELFLSMMQAPHGALVAVLPAPLTQSPLFVDGILLTPILDIAQRVAEYRRAPTPQTASAVDALLSLARGMINSDGITVFRSDGALLGYNVFVRHPPTSAAYPSRIGGARRRTYEVLCQQVGAELVAAFYRSQDGHAECHAGLLTNKQ